LPEEYENTSSKKGFVRYWTPKIKSLLSQLTNAEERREQSLRNTMKELFRNFDNHYNAWSRAIQCLSILDVLVSLTSYIQNSEHNMCRPEVVMINENDNPKPFIGKKKFLKKIII
jgi:DNA mismatch repair protein MSH6